MPIQGPMRLLPAALAVLAIGGATVPPAQAATRSPDVRAFRGLSTWVDGYDYARELTSRPSVTAASVKTMKAQGIRTIWLQAAKTSSRTPGLMMSPDRVGAILHAAHSQRIRVIAGYLPTFQDTVTDWRRTKALVDFTAGGQRFDGLALDIEDNKVDVTFRNARLVRLSQQLRASTTRPTTAIVMPPVITEIINPGYWGGTFPWLQLKGSYDVWAPMGYFTAYTRRPPWRDAPRSTAEDIRRLRNDLHSAVAFSYVGGLAVDATPADYERFSRAAKAAGTLGISVYDYASTPSWAWARLRAAAS
jgi:hypothetical protein